jgi:glutamine amidotransferase
MKKIIVVVDHGLGNILSLLNALDYLKIDFKIIKTLADVPNIDIDKIIIPGVGAFPEAMRRLKESRLDKFIIKKANENTHILGICIGMQILFTKSYEFNECNGLNLIEGEVVKLKSEINKKHLLIPVVGWKQTTSVKKNKNIFNAKFINNKYFYYLHSFYCIPKNNNYIHSFYKRESQKISSVVIKNNIWGVQFHPEKSSSNGLQFLKEFMEI